MSFSLQQWGFSKCSCQTSFRWLHSSIYRKKHFFWKEREMQLYSSPKMLQTLWLPLAFFSLRVDFSQTFWTRKNWVNKVRSKCTLRKGGFFKVISDTFWRCLQYKANQYFVGEDEMFCRSWQYYVNDRCVKGNVCSCLERIFRSKTHVFCKRSKIWFFPVCGKAKMGGKIIVIKLLFGFLRSFSVRL